MDADQLPAVFSRAHSSSTRATLNQKEKNRSCIRYNPSRLLSGDFLVAGTSRILSWKYSQPDEVVIGDKVSASDQA